MGLSPSDKRIVQLQFIKCCKKAAEWEAADYFKEINELAKNETAIAELPENMFPLSTKDAYFQHEHLFNVAGVQVVVIGDDIAEIIKILPEKYRDIILLSYFTGAKDAEISEKLKMVHRTVQRYRTSALSKLKKFLEEKENGEKD